ncbi:MAG: hypothetical protein ACXVFX_19565 [Blastococcus sp.]
MMVAIRRSGGVIKSKVQGRREQAHRMAALLLVIRDAIEPLGPSTPDPVRRFLGEVVDRLRR